MNKQDIVTALVGAKKVPPNSYGAAFAPANIALGKYWGKRDEQLNLPITNSLSISLGDRGTYTEIARTATNCDEIYVNGAAIAKNSEFYLRFIEFLDLFRLPGVYFKIITNSNIPIAAGVASSASGFAAATRALNELFAWNLSESSLSILARLGSGSACRSLWHGFVEWHAGKANDGLDSFAIPLPYIWPTLRVGLLIFTTAAKLISSRRAMAVTVNTSPFYSLWPARVNQTIAAVKAAIIAQDFSKFGTSIENNALEMHALMLTAKPTIIYNIAATLVGMEQVWQARKQGIEVYFTQDAGPNLKLLFLAKDQAALKIIFPNLEIIAPWITTNTNERQVIREQVYG